MERLPSVAEWMAGQDVLITGATGFLGKALVEKILRSCSRVNRLYLIVRSKGGNDPDERIKEYKKQVIFSVLLDKYPDAFDKVSVIPGDMSLPECGISEKHQQILKENVSIVFHVAATVRFDHRLSDALKMNTRGTYELIQIAKKMKKLEVFEYVSTTYCNAHLDEVIAEKVYPSHLDWKVMLDLLDKEDHILDTLQNKILAKQPNTYTLSKSLAENAVLEASNEIPALIIRPSVVVSSLKEPFPGWTDNLNGIGGVSVACSKGVLRTFKCAKHTKLDFVAVDVSVNGLIASAWTKRFFNNGKGDLQVFNQAYGEDISLSFEEIVEYGTQANRLYPTENYIWYPFIILTNNTYYYHLLFIILQLIPAIIQDLILRAMNHKPLLVRLNTKIYNAAIALSEFSVKVYRFDKENYRAINDKLTPEDQITFPVDEKNMEIDVEGYLASYVKGLKKYVFNEKEEDLPRFLRNHRRQYYIHTTTKFLLIGFVLWKLLQFASQFFV